MPALIIPFAFFVASLINASVVASQFLSKMGEYGIKEEKDDWRGRTFKVLYSPEDRKQVELYWMCRILIFIHGGLYVPHGSMDSPTDIVICGIQSHPTQDRRLICDRVSILTQNRAVLAHGHHWNGDRVILRDTSGARLVGPMTLLAQHQHGDPWGHDIFIAHEGVSAPVNSCEAPAPVASPSSYSYDEECLIVLPPKKDVAEMKKVKSVERASDVAPGMVKKSRNASIAGRSGRGGVVA